MKLVKSIVGIVLVIVVGVVYFMTRSNGTISKEEKEFSVKSTHTVSRIVVSKATKDFEIIRDRGKWVSNSGNSVASKRIDELFLMLQNIIPQYPISGEFKDSIEGGMDKHAISYSFYAENKLIKSVSLISDQSFGGEYVRQSTGSHIYKVYAASLVQFKDFADLRLLAWQEKQLFSEEPAKITSVTVTFHQKAKSYTLLRDETDFYLESEAQLDKKIDATKARLYLAEFNNVELDNVFTDSLEHTQLYASILIKRENQDEKNLAIFTILGLDGQSNKQQAMVSVNGTCYGEISWYRLDPLLPSVEYWNE